MTNKEKWENLLKRVEYLRQTNEYFKVKLSENLLTNSGYTIDNLPDLIITEFTHLVDDTEILAKAQKNGKTFEEALRLLPKR